MCISSLRTLRPQETCGPQVSQERRSTKQGEKSRHPHIIVQHNYHDHAKDPKPASFKDSDSQRGGVYTPFPLKLHEMLDRVEDEGFSHIISWQPHGRCFVVHKPDLFKDLLPRYFKLSKIASFQRQLNLYGFQRLTRGMDKGGYYHELFLRNKPYLAPEIQRVKVKGTGIRARSNPEQEPDFWAMTWIEGGAAQVSSSSSVVSNDTQMEEDEQQEEEEEEESSCQTVQPMQAVSSQAVPSQAVPSQAVLSSPIAPLAPRVEQEPEDIVLRGWGKPFHYLDLSKVNFDNAALPTVTSNEVAGAETFFQDQEFDELVSRIFEDEIDFSEQLDRAVA